jgi:riboflavin synthase
MFTGLIQTVGKIVKYDGAHLGIRSSLRQIQLGESISIDGICLTVARKSGPVLHFDVGPETRRITTLGHLKPGASVNLERALRIGDRLGGHWVTGHVELTGRIEKVEAGGKNRWMFIRLPKEIARYTVSKGSLAVDGISLTVAGLKKSVVKIMLIPHTLKQTTLGQKRAGDRVNLEADLLAKYALKRRHPLRSLAGDPWIPRLRPRGMTS